MSRELDTSRQFIVYRLTQMADGGPLAFDAELVRAAIAALTASPQRAPGVDEAMVIRASNAYFDALPVHGGEAANTVALRAALEAALTSGASGAGGDA